MKPSFTPSSPYRDFRPSAKCGKRGISLAISNFALHVSMAALLPEKYRPSQFGELSYHLEQRDMLESLVSSPDFPHLLIYGPSGAGKSTRIRCILQKLYGSGAAQMRLTELPFTTASKKKMQINCASSNYHTELTPSDAGIHDRIVVQDVIKSMASTNQLNTKSQRAFKVVVLKEAENLTREAQDALRRTMEKYMKTCRIILCCTNLSKISGPLQSRCMGIRVAAPTNDDIMNVMDVVAKKEKLQVPAVLVESILQHSRRNLRRALLLLQTAKTEQYPFREDQTVKEPQWMTYMGETVSLFLEKKSSAQETLLAIRQRLNELIQHLIPVPVIFEEIVRRLLQLTDQKYHKAIVESAGECEELCIKGSKPIIHLERFAVEVLCILN
ncbi:hypothetical protein L596_015513 [Steinernema carpocapsae]|uniref:AAA+ ATPase domain-containing protein n=2 Tax=Steinernema carpocapsae TaxID=34508 RepID=A0A4U5NGG9_STECR|nr:hypothetical protein L596_015513 [Steinernema carpocapsae]